MLKKTLMTLVLSSVVSIPALAEVMMKDFTEAEFMKLNEAGKTVLVDVHADWCPTCRKQEKVLNKFAEQHPDAELTVLRVDFDTQKKWVTYFKAPRQSTFALYDKGEQVWFAVAETRARVINKELLKYTGGM